jgi:hypothetical protein
MTKAKLGGALTLPGYANAGRACLASAAISPNILLIPGTSSVKHLRENLAAAALELPSDAIAELSAIGASAAAGQPKTARRFSPWSVFSPLPWVSTDRNLSGFRVNQALRSLAVRVFTTDPCIATISGDLG